MSPRTARANSSDSDKSQSRITRACDRCRRTRNKCIRSGSESESQQPCRTCISFGMRPLHKRGPPKGYVKALERRLQEVEGLLRAIIGSQDVGAQSLIADLRRDPTKLQVIEMIEQGPFGSDDGGALRASTSTKKEMLDYILQGAPTPSPSSNDPSRRLSRNSREQITSYQDTRPSVRFQLERPPGLPSPNLSRSHSLESTEQMTPYEDLRTSMPPVGYREPTLHLPPPSTDSIHPSPRFLALSHSPIGRATSSSPSNLIARIPTDSGYGSHLPSLEPESAPHTPHNLPIPDHHPIGDRYSPLPHHRYDVPAHHAPSPYQADWGVAWPVSLPVVDVGQQLEWQGLVGGSSPWGT
ncbi:hypothetical protein JAAARDRAFT_56822 [Jaapia argillacea MUCL 33604]|uniref:Zn(2)-C6 fungal-type domain-containing protein n=1 Tax=Jaapia argillacea MUCL 33604 TaxID=933084 RepID=A0A067QBD5_9AGAM|nr:hypothetical protein JAAARDRAFT_56822 [Jaapia argillacea MUCL 33604]